MDLSVGVLVTFLRLTRLTSVLFLVTICVGCGDTFRPVAVPIIPPPPNPSGAHFVLVINGNGFGTTSGGTVNQGASTRIDVSGDTNVGVARVGLGPVHAALLPNSSLVYVANLLEDTVSSFAPTSIGPVTTTSLPPGSKPVFVHTAESGTVYVANFGDGLGNGTVSAISTSNDVVMKTITVGIAPVALAETRNRQKLYVANRGNNGTNGSVTSISPIDDTVNPPIRDSGGAVAVWFSPVWAAARSDSQRVYVLDKGNSTISAIDTSTDIVKGTDPAVSVGAGADFMVYDPKLNRLYVTSSTGDTLSIFDASADPPTALTATPLTIPQPPGQNPCQGAPVVPTSVAPLPDGSQVFVASYQLNGSIICSQVSVIGTTGNTISATIPTTPQPPAAPVTVDTNDPTGCGTTRFRVSVAASADSSRVYVANCDLGGTAIIDTFPGNGNSSDSLVFELPAPVSDFQPSTVSITAASQSGSNTTYSYAPVLGSTLRVGMTVVVTGMVKTAVNDNGTFTITALDAATFTVVNPSGVTTSGQSGNGTATASQNPVFVLAGP